MQASLVPTSEGDLLAVALGLLFEVASLVVEHWLSCPTACRIFSEQGLNLSPLHWQTTKDDLPNNF